MNSSLVSIIVPVYKVEKFLEKCIVSIINQSYPYLEIILVDDGSPDNCPKICDDFAKLDSRIKVIHQDNLGLPKARRSGYEISTGAYIFFVDSDDFIETDCIKILIEHANKSKADIVVAGIKNVSNDGVFIVSRLKPNIYNKKDIYHLLSTNFLFDKEKKVSSYPLYAWGKLIRRELMDGYFDVSTQFRYWEDIPSTFFLIKKTNVLEVVDHNLYNYVIHSNQVTKRPLKDIFHYYVDVWNYLEKTDTDGFLHIQLPQRIWWICMDGINTAIKTNPNYKDFQELFHLIRKTPIVQQKTMNPKILTPQAPTYRILHFFFRNNLAKPYYLLVKLDIINKIKSTLKL